MDLSTNFKNNNENTKDSPFFTIKFSFRTILSKEIGIIKQKLCDSKSALCMKAWRALWIFAIYVIFTNNVFLLQSTDNYILITLFTYFIIPLRTCFINASIFLTLVMSKHRYRSIIDPHTYYAEQTLINKKITSIKYILLSYFFGTLLNLPAFFEQQLIINTHEYWEKHKNGSSYYVSFLIMVFCSMLPQLLIWQVDKQLETGVHVGLVAISSVGKQAI